MFNFVYAILFIYNFCLTFSSIILFSYIQRVMLKFLKCMILVIPFVNLKTVTMDTNGDGNFLKAEKLNNVTDN